jgi:hypothetical protein
MYVQVPVPVLLWLEDIDGKIKAQRGEVESKRRVNNFLDSETACE